MRHKRDSKTRTGTAMLAISSILLVACGEEVVGSESEAGTSDVELFTYCAESRGSLLEFSWMVDGRKPVNTSTLDHGANFMGRLADRVAAADTVRSDIGRWNAALQTWRDQMRAIPPRFENGRVIEPDLSGLNQALITELQPVGKSLTAWVSKTCENVRL